MKLHKINELIELINDNVGFDVELYLLLKNVDDDEFDIENDLYYYDEIYDKYEFNDINFEYIEIYINNYNNLKFDDDNILLIDDIIELKDIGIDNSIIDINNDNMIIELYVDEFDIDDKINNLKGMI